MKSAKSRDEKVVICKKIVSFLSFANLKMLTINHANFNCIYKKTADLKLDFWALIQELLNWTVLKELFNL